ncbi:uncharacterized protein Z518_10531 [Rhinocladiella mackenziei CBS 650.93]|uniref:Pyruvate decarboxylase n=1 Tax=Rhinocladiella mackenziei CBS 650.93 TaxID=1442369 RepID=A0A0D2FEA0_9EURO|nr:uncharacterized protein Z518_10531 [Rhinocladiella mackenziei CBS 650.93]KIX00392.1 hypothetical protein Z518_10531 [Rhinocladiella mackenziei CBS 650.93]
MSELKEPVSLAHYIWTRIHQLGVRSVHGVPGDYNLNLLDNISSTGLRWVGSCNELNGGYATDGYGRVKGIGVLVTTGGVGELSAINAHAGAYSEQVSLVHIVGSPPLSIRANKRFCMHHSLGNHEYDTFKNMFKTISVAHVTLADVSSAPAQIDCALRQSWVASRPVYIDVPSDMGKRDIEGAGLATPLELSYPVNPPEGQQEILAKLQERLHVAKRPCILIDLCATRQRITKEVHQLIAKSRLPTFVTPLAQGFVDESLPNFGGLYAGYGSAPGVRDFVESSDLILHLGPLDTDVTTYLGSANLNKSSVVRFLTDQVEMDDTQYQLLHMRPLLLAAIVDLDFSKVSVESFNPPSPNGFLSTTGGSSLISQDWLWPYISSWLEPEDIILTDTGTASFGIFNTRLPPRSLLINISLWASIGYSLPSAQGAALAAQDDGSNRRTILFQGDGSFQLTCQEISTMIKHRLRVIMFIICNNGYTIERVVHETNEDYNDVSNWNYKEILRVFDSKSLCSRSYQVRTQDELTNLLADKEFSSYKGLVELHIPELDVPAPLRRLAELITAR